MSLIKVRINWGKTTRDSNSLCFDFLQEMLCVVLVLLKLVLTVFQYMLSNSIQRIGSVFLNLPSPINPTTCRFFTLCSCFYCCPGFQDLLPVTRHLQLLYLLKESSDRGQAAIHSSSLDKKEHKAKYLSPAIRPCFPYTE